MHSMKLDQTYAEDPFNEWFKRNIVPDPKCYFSALLISFLFALTTFGIVHFNYCCCMERAALPCLHILFSSIGKQTHTHKKTHEDKQANAQNRNTSKIIFASSRGT